MWLTWFSSLKPGVTWSNCHALTSGLEAQKPLTHDQAWPMQPLAQISPVGSQTTC
jgi:hypothetical protein